MSAIVGHSMHNAAPSILSAVKKKKSMLDHVFDPYCQISRHNITNMSFQSGGAILGPPGAPGAPVIIIFAVPEANALQCPTEECQQVDMLML